MMMLPFCNVVPELKYETKYAQSNSKSSSGVSCLTSPSTMVFRCRSLGFPSTDVDTIPGPKGAYPSKPLENPHCGILPANSGSR